MVSGRAVLLKSLKAVFHQTNFFAKRLFLLSHELSPGTNVDLFNLNNEKSIHPTKFAQWKTGLSNRRS